MAEILGFLAGLGMIAFIGLLVSAFLKEMGWMRRDAARLLGRSAGMTCLAGGAYLALALLHHMAVYGKIEGPLTLGTLFHGPYMTAMLSALGDPAGVGPVSLGFAFLSHLLGGALFGQYVFAGMLLTWGMTAASLYLIQLRLQQITDDQAARDAALLLLFFPFGIFFLLPGAAPLCLLLAAAAFFVLTRRVKAWKLRLSPTAYGWLLAVCALLSAAVTVCVAEGRLG